MDEHRPVMGRPCPAPPPHDDGETFSQVVDGRRGSVRARGTLTSRTADQLRGTVEALRRSGHDRILLDLSGLRAADGPGLRSLASLRTAVHADGGRLTVVPAVGEIRDRDARSA